MLTDVCFQWQKLLDEHKEQIPKAWKDDSSVISILHGTEPFDLIIEGLKTQKAPSKFKINFGLIDKPQISPKIVELFKIIEDYDKYYSLELNVYTHTTKINNNSESKAFIKTLLSPKCKINTLHTKVVYGGSLFRKLFKKSASITDLNITVGSTAKIEDAIKLFKGIKKNGTIQRLKIAPIKDRSVTKIFESNHTITAIELELEDYESPTIEDILRGVAKMGSLKSIKILGSLPKNLEPLLEAIKCNKNLEKFCLFDEKEEANLSKEEAELLATTITAHPALQKLTLPGFSICPLIKAISSNNVLKTLEVPVKHIVADEELQKSLLSMK